jgi:hypothetical protein
LPLHSIYAIVQDYELAQCSLKGGQSGPYAELCEPLLETVLSYVPTSNRVWAVIPASASNSAAAAAYAAAGFEPVSLQEAFSTLWPSALFFGSPLFLATLTAAGAIVGLPLLPFVAKLLDTVRFWNNSCILDWLAFRA